MLAGLEQKPDAPLDLLDSDFDQAGRAGVAMTALFLVRSHGRAGLR